jgi:hypothetical protein
MWQRLQRLALAAASQGFTSTTMASFADWLLLGVERERVGSLQARRAAAIRTTASFPRVHPLRRVTPITG